MKLLKQEIMKVYTRLLLTILVVSAFTAAYAQEDAEAFNKYDNLYISFGAGTSVLREASDIYFAGSSNIQLGFMYERALQKRFSVITGID